MIKPNLLETIQREGFSPIKRGGRWWLRCPFHDDRNPSLVIDEEKQVWFCHGCGKGGDVITFIQELYNLEFKEAINHLGIESKSSPRIKLKTKTQAKATELETKLQAAFTEWCDERICYLRDQINGIYALLSLIRDEESFERLGILYRDLSLKEYELDILINGSTEEKLNFAQKDPKWRLISSWIIAKYKGAKNGRRIGKSC